jgi:ATP-dependent DNA ligase
MPPVSPMLAKLSRELPAQEGMLYEPKWDGFRCIAFRDGEELELGSRNDRPLTRYFPELVDLLRGALPDRCVVDGEIVVVTEDGLDFDALQQRLHPAASRVQRLAQETPASFVAFDLLALGDSDLTGEPFRERRRLLEGALTGDRDRVHLTPITNDPDVAEDWFTRFEGAGFDGVMAKPADQPYLQDKRVMWKVKHERTADCVVGGFRYGKDSEQVGSLLLGLYDEEGRLNHVGFTSTLPREERPALTRRLENLRKPPGFDGRAPGGPSRWSTERSGAWEPLAPKLVVEVRYDHVTGGRFRHGTALLRWRPDKAPRQCTFEQLSA